MRTHSKQSTGFTVIELIVAIAVLAILVTMGIPAIQEMIKNNRVTAQTNELVAMINFSRNEALRRNSDIPVDLTSVTGGWSGEVRSPDDLEDTEGCTVGVLRCASYDSVELTSGSVEMTFNNRGYLTPFSDGEVNLIMQHEGCSSNRQARLIKVRPTGQVSTCDVPCGHSSSACP